MSSLGCFLCLDKNKIFPDLVFSFIFFMLLQMDSVAAHFRAFFSNARNTNLRC